MAKPFASFVQPVSFETTRQTYSCVAADFTLAATATDYLTISGPADGSKVIRVTRIRFTADATAATAHDVYLYQRTAANTAGTSAAQTAAAHDTQDGAASAIVLLYSANPSALGAGNLLRGEEYALPAAGTTGYPFSPIVWDFGEPAKCPTLRNANDLLCLSNKGNAVPAGFKGYAMIEWTEDTI